MLVVSTLYKNKLMIQYTFRLLWALFNVILITIMSLFSFFWNFTLFSYVVDTRETLFFKPIETLGEHGLWKSHFHWALKLETNL